VLLQAGLQLLLDELEDRIEADSLLYSRRPKTLAVGHRGVWGGGGSGGGGGRAASSAGSTVRVPDREGRMRRPNSSNPGVTRSSPMPTGRVTAATMMTVVKKSLEKVASLYPCSRLWVTATNFDSDGHEASGVQQVSINRFFRVQAGQPLPPVASSAAPRAVPAAKGSPLSAEGLPVAKRSRLSQRAALAAGTTAVVPTKGGIQALFAGMRGKSAASTGSIANGAGDNAAAAVSVAVAVAVAHTSKDDLGADVPETSCGPTAGVEFVAQLSCSSAPASVTARRLSSGRSASTAPAPGRGDRSTLDPSSTPASAPCDRLHTNMTIQRLAQAPPVASAVPEQWACSSCTLLNNHPVLCCTICGQPWRAADDLTPHDHASVTGGVDFEQ
jgi:hypothetical protein